MRILLTGASGLVGSAVARLGAAQGHQVLGLVSRYPEQVPGVAEQRACDLRHLAGIAPLLRQWHPEVIIHCAAISEPADCEADPARSQQLNVDVPGALAAVAEEREVRLVHVSTEQVFAGDRAPYLRDDPVRPLHRYGRQKAEAEIAVHAAAPRHAVTVRAPLLMGNSLTGRRSVHERLLVDWRDGRVPRLYRDEIRQVAHADNLALALLELAQRRELTGVYHWAGTDPRSRYELGVAVRDRFRLGVDQAPIQGIRRADQPAAAATRPADLRLDLRPLAALLQTRPQSLAEQLAHLHVPASCRPWLSRF